MQRAVVTRALYCALQRSSAKCDRAPAAKALITKSPTTVYDRVRSEWVSIKHAMMHFDYGEYVTISQVPLSQAMNASDEADVKTRHDIKASQVWT